MNLPLGQNPLAVLSNAEVRVVSLITKGLKAKEMAQELKVSTKTIKFHITNINKKLKTRSKIEIALKVLGNLWSG